MTLLTRTELYYTFKFEPLVWIVAFDNFIKLVIFFFLNLLSQEGGGGGGLLQPPCPFSDFPSCRFCLSAKIAIRSIYPPFVQIPMYLRKIFSKIFSVIQIGGRGVGGCNTPPFLRGKGWQQK